MSRWRDLGRRYGPLPVRRGWRRFRRLPSRPAARTCSLRRPATDDPDHDGLRVWPGRPRRPLLHRVVPRTAPTRCPWPRAGGGRRHVHAPLRRITRRPSRRAARRPGRGADFVGDLAEGSFLPDSAFDCIVLTQTLHLIYDFPAALRTVSRVLAPNGVLLMTVPGISNVDPAEWGSTWHYSFTRHSLERMCATAFEGFETEVASFGNVLAAVAFLHGLGCQELTPRGARRCSTGVRAHPRRPRRQTPLTLVASGCSGSSGRDPAVEGIAIEIVSVQTRDQQRVLP